MGAKSWPSSSTEKKSLFESPVSDGELSRIYGSGQPNLRAVARTVDEFVESPGDLLMNL